MTYWVERRIDWRNLSGVEMTWLLYSMYVPLIPEKKLRQFFTETEDWKALRALDSAAFAGESDL